MPSYFYHLKFELYPYPSPDPASANTKPRTKAEARESRREVYLPPAGSDIFSTKDWPKHKALEGGADPRRFRAQGFSSSRSEGDGREHKPIRKAAVVIDCGPSRATNSSEDDADNERITVPIANSAKHEFPPPSPAHIQSDLASARKDWRFGRVRIESVDMVETAARQRGESSSAMVSPAVGINAGLADVGRVTKARFEAVEKGTEVGWGVVHLYRDGEETIGMGMEVYSPGHKRDNEAEKEGKAIEDDCTVLCIPAVPSYLTPSDFLGFVGEKTMESVSHFRMVMTGRMNRYLVLMKFRDVTAARAWKKEFDGKVFNSMEVSFPLLCCASSVGLLCSSCHEVRMPHRAWDIEDWINDLGETLRFLIWTYFRRFIYTSFINCLNLFATSTKLAPLYLLLTIT